MINTTVQIKGISLNRNDINIPTPLLETVRNTLIQNSVTQESLSKYIRGELSQVKQMAYDYLTFLNLYISEIQNIIIEEAKVKKSISITQNEKGMYELSFSIRKLKKLQKELTNTVIILTQLTQQFSNLLKIQMGKVPILAYNHLTSSSPTSVYIVDEISKILSIESQTSGINNPRLKYGLLQLKKQLLTNDERFNNLLNETQLKNLQLVFNEVLHRWNKFIYDHTPKHFILWNMGSGKGPRSDWKGMWLDQRGDLVEAYQRAIFTRNNNFTNDLKSLPEKNIQTFMELVLLVDSSSGLLESDIQVQIDGILYSISSKSHGAEPMGIKQAIDLATAILKAEDLTEQNVKDWLNNYNIKNLKSFGERNAILDVTENTLNGLTRVGKGSGS